MNHRAVGGRDCQKWARDQGTRGSMEGWAGWAWIGLDGRMGWRPEKAVEITERDGGQIGRSDRWRIVFGLVVSRSRLESSLRIPGQRREGGGPRPAAGRAKRGDERKHTAAEPRSRCGIEFEKGGTEWRDSGGRGHGCRWACVLSCCRFRRTLELCAERINAHRCRDPERQARVPPAVLGLPYTFLGGSCTAQVRCGLTCLTCLT